MVVSLRMRADVVGPMSDSYGVADGIKQQDATSSYSVARFYSGEKIPLQLRQSLPGQWADIALQSHCNAVLVLTDSAECFPIENNYWMVQSLSQQ